MTTIRLPNEFLEFLRLLNENDVRYLVVGGYAVAYHGYPRTTADIDIWIARDENNANRMVSALSAFGFGVADLDTSLFLNEHGLVRMGHAPVCIEILMSIPGVEFEQCYVDRHRIVIDDTSIDVIGLEALRTNKAATGRHRDLDDLENLPDC